MTHGPRRLGGLSRMRPDGAVLSLGVVVALITGVTMGSTGTNVMPVFMDDFADRFGLSGAGAGLVGAAQLTATALVTLLLARRAARPGRVAMARVGLVVAACGSAAVFAAIEPITLVLANLVVGAGLGVVYAAATAALAAAGNADKASAITITGTVATAALLIVAVPAANQHWGGTGFVVVALCCVPAWFLVRGLPDSPGRQGEDASVDVVPGRLSVVLLGGTAVLWAITQGTWAYASLLGRQHTGMSAATVSVILAVSSVVALSGALAGAPIAHRFGRLTSMAVLVAVEAASVAVVVVSGDPVMFTAAAVVWQACQLAVLVQMLAVAAVLDPTGRLVASLSGAGALGTGAGPLVVGLILDSAGPGVLGVVLAVGMVVVSLPLLRMTTAAGVPIAAGEASSR